MASACVNTVGVSPESFLDRPHGWISPRISAKPEKKLPEAPEDSDLGDFEFRLGDSATMLPADELFFDGKLVPLQMTAARAAETTEASRSCSRTEIVNAIVNAIVNESYLQSPRAPRCSVRWRELLGLRKNKPEATSPHTQTTSLSPSSSPNSAKSIRQFLHRKSISKDSDCESSSLSISSSRLSLSSSSSGHDYDDLPRLSLDVDIKPTQSQIPSHRSTSSGSNQLPRHYRMRSVKETQISRAIVSADSPRLSSSGKIVFQSLGRSSSSPSSFNGGPRYRHRGMERSYSANVRVTPLLNVPVCSLRGSSKSGVFGFGQKKKEANSGSKSSIGTGIVASGTGGRVTRK